MSDLFRDHLDDFGQSLLEAGEVDAPRPGARDALLASVMTSASLAPTLAAGAGSATKAAVAGKGVSAAIVKWMIVGAVAATAVASGGVAVMRAKEQAPETLRAVQPGATMHTIVDRPLSPPTRGIETALLPDAPPAAVPAAGSTARPRTSAPAVGRSTPEPEPIPIAAAEGPAEARGARMLSEQVMLLDRVRASLQKKDRTSALATLDDYDRRFGSSAALGPEARRLRAQAEAIQDE